MENKTLVSTKSVWIFEAGDFRLFPAIEIGSKLLLLKEGVGYRMVTLGLEAFETEEELAQSREDPWSVDHGRYGYLNPIRVPFYDRGYAPRLTSRADAIKYCIEKNESRVLEYQDQVREGERVIARQKELLEQIAKGVDV